MTDTLSQRCCPPGPIATWARLAFERSRGSKCADSALLGTCPSCVYGVGTNTRGEVLRRPPPA
eukprot:6276140-Prymnesium_polylepis.1